MEVQVKPPKPPYRSLRGYAFDPSQSLNLDTVGINEITYQIPWEDNLSAGPEGEYVKVIDRDPSSKAIYTPVNLNDRNIIATDGLAPSVSNPQFHQQMVYAVSMNTIKNFEKAIGRKVMWSTVKNPTTAATDFVKQLLIYPHALREANAYYSSDRKALLFGYFNATPAHDDLQMPGSLVFTCLSHDIIAHETTHAILDGIFRHYMEQTHPDVGAFHEAFADVVALFQHFTFPEALKSQIAKVGGNFDAENLLGQLAVEFGLASGGYGALRDAIGTMDNKKWKRTVPNTNDYRTIFEPHDRGSILVAAVFDVFITIYKQRSADLIRIATNGTGILPKGAINEDLVNRLAAEAAKAAAHILNMCIRALDYCPPVDINYGDYLRAIITADVELVADDQRNYRIAFIDAFRKRGIYPEGISNLSIESLTYEAGEQSAMFQKFATTLNEFLRDYKNHIGYEVDREKIFDKTMNFIANQAGKGKKKNGTYDIKGLHEYFFEESVKNEKNNLMFEKLTGLVFSKQYKQININESKTYKNGPSIQIHSLRLNNRVGPTGNLQNQAIITLAQRCGVNVKYNEKDDDYVVTTFNPDNKKKIAEDGSFIFRGGCTLIFDLNTLELKHVISKPIIDMTLLNGKRRQYKINKQRAIMQYRCTWGDYAELTGFAAAKNTLEPLAHIHKHKTETV